MLPHKRLVSIPCHLYPGMFSSERYFTVRMANGEEYTGLAPSHYCWDAEGRTVYGEKEPRETEGRLAARIADSEVPDTQIAVVVPDGEVLSMWKDLVGPRPTELPTYVPHQS